MATVIRMVEYSNRETLAILSALTARAMRGEVIGLALCFRSKLGIDQCVFTGPYNNPATAVNAAARMSWEMVRQQAATD
jgi:hypothetical protein